jgi:hypothetical protein
VNGVFVSSVAFSPDGKALAAGYGGGIGGGGGVVVWDVAARQRLSVPPLPVNGVFVSSVAFSPDGKALAAGCGVGVVLFDARGERLRTAPLVVGEDSVDRVAFEPSGTIAAGYGVGVLLLGVDPEPWEHQAARIANRNFTRDEWRRYFPDEPYRRTFRSLPWPDDMPEDEKKRAEAWDREHPEEQEANR